MTGHEQGSNDKRTIDSAAWNSERQNGTRLKERIVLFQYLRQSMRTQLFYEAIGFSHSCFYFFSPARQWPQSPEQPAQPPDLRCLITLLSASAISTAMIKRTRTVDAFTLKPSFWVRYYFGRGMGFSFKDSRGSLRKIR